MGRPRKFRIPETTARISITNHEKLKRMLHFGESMDDRIGMLINFYLSKGAEVDQYMSEQIESSLKHWKKKIIVQEKLILA